MLSFRPRPDRWVTAAAMVFLAILALIYPVWPGTELEQNLGSLLVWAGIIEVYDGFRRAQKTSKNSAQVSGLFSMIMGGLLINADLFRTPALHLFVLIIFLLDCVRYLFRWIRAVRRQSFMWFDLLALSANFIIVILFLVFARETWTWVMSVAACIRIAGIGIIVLTSVPGVLEQVDIDVVKSLNLADDEHVRAVAARVREEEERAAFYDTRWIITFLLLLFVIHLGRMGFDRSFLGILSPLVATLGDAIIAVIITYLIFAPVRIAFLNLFRRRSQRLWAWINKVEQSKRRIISIRTLATHWLTRRMRAEIRFRKAGYSPGAAVRTGLKIGLPPAAMLAAIMPVLGMSWYFDTENWASGIWDKWAAHRADTWRMAMTSAVDDKYDNQSFRLTPEGVNDGDFSFVVLGDPGEGDASQWVLKDQILDVMNHPDVRFMVISSDVVYPTGSLNDYERKFWLPMKGVTKPVYAIPGNHDWYDALDGFVATFYEPAAARKAMEARIGSDMHITATTRALMEDMITKTEAWRKEYQVPTGFQNAPYFQVQTGDFVFISIETGVVRQIDPLQLKWLKNVLEASRGKFVMALLGHPFYAIGEYEGRLNPAFDSLHSLLRRYNVPLVMAGDTHDLEYYLEPAKNGGRPTHNFVNGGGGAYLSIGAAMAEPGTMPTKDYAFFPSRAPLEDKIERHTKWYKWPAWWWTKKLNGWPFSAEWLSAMFDYNVSPFFQSFMEIKVQRSQHRVVLIPYSNHGRIKWKDMTSTAGSRPPGAKDEDDAEWVISM